jgi:hypothetical protein
MGVFDDTKEQEEMIEFVVSGFVEDKLFEILEKEYDLKDGTDEFNSLIEKAMNRALKLINQSFSFSPTDDPDNIRIDIDESIEENKNDIFN